MPIEIACGHCGDSFGVEASWAGLIVQCPFCETAVQVPDEVAAYADEPREPSPPTVEQIPVEQKIPGEPPVRRAEQSPKPPRKTRFQERPTKPSTNRPTPEVRIPDPDLADTQPVSSLDLLLPPSKTTTPITGPTTDRTPAPQTTPAASPPPPPEPTSTAPQPTPTAPDPTPAAPDPPTLPLPEWTVPPTCAWLLEGNAGAEIRLNVRQGVTTIHYQGRKMVLRDQPEVANWYGRITFAMSIMTLVVLLTWFYYLFR
jgi:hypothetical protein